MLLVHNDAPGYRAIALRGVLAKKMSVGSQVDRTEAGQAVVNVARFKIGDKAD